MDQRLSKKPRIYTTDEWNKKRAAFEALYLSGENTLTKAMKIMEKDHNFYATKAQYKIKIKTWGLRKNREYKSKTVRGNSTSFKHQMEPTGEDGCAGHLRKKNGRTGRNGLGTDLSDWENVRTVIPARIEQPTKTSMEALTLGSKNDNTIISGFHLPGPDLRTELFNVGPVEDVSFSESDASSQSLWSFGDNAIQEQHHMDIDGFEYKSLETQEGGQRPSNSFSPVPPTLDKIVNSLAENKDIELSPADIALHDVSEGHKGMARFILQNDTHLSRDNWSSGETALNKAARYGSEDMIHLLLKFSTDVSSRGSDGESALHWAAVRNHQEVARLLLEKGIDLSPNSHGETALHLAVFYGHKEIVRLILTKDIDLSQKDLDGNTALDFAESNNHEKIACILRGRDRLKTWIRDLDDPSDPSDLRDDPPVPASKMQATFYPPLDRTNNCPDLFSLWKP